MEKYAFLVLFLTFASCTKKEAIKKEHYQLLDATATNDEIHYFILDENKDTVKKFKNKYHHIWYTTAEDILMADLIDTTRLWAIDKNEDLLFEIYNTQYGYPSPDKFINGKIRMIGKDRKIGYANEKGEIVIPPQFEEASEFRNGHAIIGNKCKLVIPEGHEDEKGGCIHLIIECEENGYINEKGEIIEMGSSKFTEIAKKLGWKTNRSETFFQ
ncbi:MAG: WG repeat-containing protein [Flavobacterium sp.]|nr:MAG: WG repeat-containing protein [Flavobacterium sp.]